MVGDPPRQEIEAPNMKMRHLDRFSDAIYSVNLLVHTRI